MLTSTQRGVRWAVIVIAGLLFIYYFRGILAPYIIGMALAYFLDPLADWLEKHGLKRIVAVAIITLVALFLISIFLLVAIPLAFEQMIELFQSLPQFFDTVNTMLLERFPKAADLEASLMERFRSSASQITATISDWVLSSTASIFNLISALVIIPVVAFYLLYDWDRLVVIVDGWIPRDHLRDYRYVMGEIDRTLSGFVRGQGSVCMIMATYYSIALTLVGLNFGFAIGLIAGLLTFIPFVGGFIGGMLVIGVGLFQYVIADGNWPYYIFVLVVYFAGQSFEGNFLTPRLVGGSVGLHPVWVMFALSAGAVAAGFTGMIVGVPVAAVVGVLGRYMIQLYKDGPLYQGEEFDEEAYLASREERRRNV